MNSSTQVIFIMIEKVPSKFENLSFLIGEPTEEEEDESNSQSEERNDTRTDQSEKNL
jgi:hypothetical protein